MKQLAAALVKVQAELKPALKDSTNDAFKRDGKGSKYTDLTATWDACRVALTKNELCVVQTTDFDEHGAWLKTMLLHTSGEFIEGRFPLRPIKPDMQGMGSALTYARRYGLSAIIGLVSDVDDDGNAASAMRPEGVTEMPKPDRKAAANKWAAEATEAVSKMTNAAEFSVWHKKFANAVAEVRDFNEAGHKRLVEAIAKKNIEFFNRPLEAAQ